MYAAANPLGAQVVTPPAGEVPIPVKPKTDSAPDSNDDRFEEALRYATLIAPKLTIQGGTREVLRGIIARGLGLR